MAKIIIRNIKDKEILGCFSPTRYVTYNQNDFRNIKNLGGILYLYCKYIKHCPIPIDECNLKKAIICNKKSIKNNLIKEKLKEIQLTIKEFDFLE